MNDIIYPFDIVKKLDYVEEYTNKPVIELSFPNPVSEDDWKYNTYHMLGSRFVKESIIKNDNGDLIGARTTVHRALEFAMTQRSRKSPDDPSIILYNRLLIKLDNLKVEYDRNLWKPIVFNQG